MNATAYGLDIAKRVWQMFPHGLDPLPPLDPTRLRRQLPRRYNSHSGDHIH